jgi:hypothetical protein
MNVQKLPTPIKPVFSTYILPLELSDSLVDIDIRGDDFKIYLENKQVNLVGYLDSGRINVNTDLPDRN